MLTLLGWPARRTTSHSLMPSAMPLAAIGPLDGAEGSRRSGSGAAALACIGVPARSPATEPTRRLADAFGVCAGAAGCAAAGGAGSAFCAHRPSAVTRSSGATGPLGPSFTLACVPFAQSGVLNHSPFFENMSLYESRSNIGELEHPATPKAAAHNNAMLVTTRGTRTPPRKTIARPLIAILRHHNGA